MICEMCGAESQAIEPRKISGSVLQLCSNCAGLGDEPTYRESIAIEHMLLRHSKSVNRRLDTKKLKQMRY